MFWQYSRDSTNPYDYMRFGKQLDSDLASNVIVVTNATVIKVKLTQQGTDVAPVDFASTDGRRWNLPSASVVICSGGIENARLLLASGIGNDTVGRYLMDHPRGTVAHFTLEQSDAVLRRFGSFKSKGAGANLYQHRLRLSPAVQREEKLQNSAVWIGEAVTENDPWNALKRLLRGKAEMRSDIGKIASNSRLVARGLNDYFIRRWGLPRKLAALTLDAMSEQRPDPDSRVTLSERMDRFGVPLARTDWRLHTDDARTMRRIAELAAEEFPRMGLGAPVLEDWVRDGAMFPQTIRDVAHPTGTTRMSEDPRRGAVDTTGQVHGVAGLFVAGSSVFPTAGHANPTQMIVALALRLADLLKQRGSTVASAAVPALAQPSVNVDGDVGRDQVGHGRRVLVSGATGKIGRYVVDELLNRGYLVRAVTSKAVDAGCSDRVEWRQADLRGDVDFPALVSGCTAVLHLAAEMGDPGHMQRVNVDATRALAEASEREGVLFFGYTSSVAGYGSSKRRTVDENAPLLTAGRDVITEYWAEPGLRAYGRTKVGGEQALARVSSRVEYVVLRPTVVVDIPDLVGLVDWSTTKKAFAGTRHAHHIYVRDVADAMAWLVDRSVSRSVPQPGLSVFNLSEDSFANPTYAYLFKVGYAATRDARWRSVNLPWIFDWARALATYRTLPLRWTLGRMKFPESRIQAAGYQPRFGMAQALAVMARDLRETGSE